MVQVYIDPEKVRIFSTRLGRNTSEVSHTLTRIQAELKALGSTWRDQEYARFEMQFADAEQTLRRFAERTDEFALFLNRKAAAAEGITNLHLQGLTMNSGLMRAMNVSVMKESFDAHDGEERARHATSMVALYRGEHVKYKMETEAREHPDKFADCSSFVSATLPGLFPRTDGRFPTTSDMIRQIGGEEKFRKPGNTLASDGPKPGDIMMWQDHVGIVTSVGTNSFEYANMSVHHDAWIQQVNLDPSKNENLYDHINGGGFGEGKFLGFWTPQ